MKQLYFNFIKVESMKNVMTILINLNTSLYKAAKATAILEQRTMAGQIEYWAKVGRAALNNPDLPIPLVVESLPSLSE